MRKLVLIATAAAFSLTSGIASAATLHNMEKDVVIVGVDVGGKKDTLKMLPNQVWDSKGKDVSFVIGSGKPVMAKADDKFEIKGGKLVLIKEEVAKTTTSTTTTSTTTEPVKK